MATEMITLKLDKRFLKEVDAIVKKKHYHSRTEFIRESLRSKLDEVKSKEAHEKLKHLLGMSKGPGPTEEEYERIREEAFQEISRKLDESQ